MEFYHSTTEEARKSILANSYINPTKFDFSSYLDRVLPTLSEDSKLPKMLIGQRSVPYLLEGIYCFNVIEGARTYRESGSVITLSCDTPSEMLDVNDPNFLMRLDDFFNDELMKIIELKIFDKEYVNYYRILKEIILDYLYDIDNTDRDFPQIYAIMLFLFYNFKQENVPDVLFKQFPEFPYPYYVINNISLVKQVS